MKIKIIEDGWHRISDDMLIFKTEEGQIEVDFRSAKEITWVLLDALCFSNDEMCNILDKIDEKIYESEEL